MINLAIAFTLALKILTMTTSIQSDHPDKIMSQLKIDYPET
ncbi:hypothetical protein [Nostoc sp.]